MHNTISTASNPGFQTSPKSSFDLAKNFKLPPLNFKPVLTDEQIAALNIVNEDGLSRQTSTQGKKNRTESDDFLSGLKPTRITVSNSSKRLQTLNIHENFPNSYRGKHVKQIGPKKVIKNQTISAEPSEFQQ